MKHQINHRLQSAGLLIAVLVGWEALVRILQVPVLILPPPSAIAERLVDLIATGVIWPHLVATVTSVIVGLALGVAAGLGLGGLISMVPAFERLAYPYVVALQTVPKIAIAPLFILWFGYGVTSKIVITALVCFFPMLVSVMAGFHSTDRDQVEMLKVFGANRWQTLLRLRLPSALVMIFAGLEIASVLGRDRRRCRGVCRSPGGSRLSDHDLELQSGCARRIRRAHLPVADRNGAALGGALRRPAMRVLVAARNDAHRCVTGILNGVERR